MQINIMTKELLIKVRDKISGSKNFWAHTMVSQFSIGVFAFLFLSFCLSAHLLSAEVLPESRPVGIQNVQATIDANQTSTVSEKMQQNGTTIAGKTPVSIGSQLWRDRIIAPENKNDNTSKDELKKLIEQIRSVDFKQQKIPEPVIVVKPAPALVTSAVEGAEPNKTPLGIGVKKEPEPNLPYKPVAYQTLQMLKSKSQHPKQVTNPFQLAEILFLSGHVKEAAAFYQEALNRIDPNDANAAEDRAWILFQMGNCLRKDDLPAATKMYRQLVAEHPNSPWTELAKTIEKLADWYQKDKPKELIAEFKR